MPYFRLARDPTAAALADPYLGQSIGPVPGYGVSFLILNNFLSSVQENFSVFQQKFYYPNQGCRRKVEVYQLKHFCLTLNAHVYFIF